MGIRFTAHIRETTEITFMSAGRKDYNDLLRHYFDNENFGATAQDRFNYFDELLHSNDQLIKILFEHSIDWPSSLEVLNESQFIDKLTNEQAGAILKALLAI